MRILPHRFNGVRLTYNENTGFCAQVLGIWPCHRIEVGPKFLMLTDNEQDAVLTHEVGHVINHHVEKKIAFGLLTFWWGAFMPHTWMWLANKVYERHEREADDYAIRAGFGKQVLNVLRKFKPVDVSGMSPLLAQDIQEKFAIDERRKRRLQAMFGI